MGARGMGHGAWGMGHGNGRRRGMMEITWDSIQGRCPWLLSCIPPG